MHLTHRLLFVTLILTASGLPLRSEGTPVLPEQVFSELKPLLKDAVTQSPRMIVRNLDLAAAEGDRVQARAALLPNISGSYQVSQAQDQREDLAGRLDTDKTYYNFSISQPVFHWSERKNNARIGELRRQVAAGQFEEAYRGLALEIRNIYMQMVLKKIQLQNARNDQRLSDEALSLAEDRLARKVVAEGDIFPIRIANERSHLATERTELEFEQLKQTFANLTGQSAPADDSIPAEIYGLPPAKQEIDRLLARFLDQPEADVPQVAVLRQLMEVEGLNYQNQRKRLLPKFNLVAGISQDEQSYTANIGLKYGLQSRYVGVQAVWTIFDGFASRGATASALARKRQAEANYAQLKDTLAQDAQRAARQVDLAFREMQINDRLLASAREFLKYRQGDFQRGLASETDVAAAEASLRGSFANAAFSRYTYLMRIAEFVSLVGADPAMANLDRPKA